jgi:hypothetical protein
MLDQNCHAEEDHEPVNLAMKPVAMKPVAMKPQVMKPVAMRPVVMEPVVMEPVVMEPVPEHLWPVLEQLVVGATDLTASRRLNMSPRTFSRRVAELLESLGVETRFQGGAEVALRGWVRQPRPAPRRNAALPHGTGEVA